MLFDRFRRRRSEPEFAHITSQEKAQEAAAEGKLVAVFLVPLVCGGTESRLNVVYVPPAIKDLKDRADDTVIAAAQAGKVKHYECLPAYRDDSFVPVSLRVIGLDENHESVVSQEIPIWDFDADNS